MERLENENYVAFAKRATEALEDGLIDYEAWSNSLFGYKIYENENLRRLSKGFIKFMENIDDEDYSAGDSEQEIQDRQDALFKERCKLQDVVRYQKGNLREEARFENLCEVLKDCMGNLKPLACNRGWMLPESAERKYAILMFSDWHCGMKIDSPFNFYDVQTMRDRAEVVTEKAISYCCEHSVTDLVVEVNGDFLDGALHISSRVQQEEDVIQQIVTVSEVLSNCIDKLAPWFKTVKVYCTLGNHGRLCSKKSDCVTKENFEMLIPEFMRLRLQAHDNVTIVDSKGLDFLKYEVDGKTICMAHGQNDSVARAVEDFSKIYRVVPDEVHLAHFHSCRDIDNCNVQVTVNGSLCGPDDYAVSIRKINDPSQNLIIYDHDRCIYSLKADE